MSIESLKKLIVPPEKPLFPGSVAEWQRVENELKLQFPSDYKDYVSAYGQGLIDDELQIFNPFTTNRHARMAWDSASEAGRLLKVLADRRRGEEAKHFPFPPFPTPDGVLPIGEAERVVLYWIIRGDPENWPIVVESFSPYDHVIYKESLTSFLGGLVTRRITCYDLPRFPSSVPAPFIPSP